MIAEDIPVAAAPADSAENWNVPAILRGDGEFHLSCDFYFGSNSLDGTVSGFWPIICESLSVTWAPTCIITVLTGRIVL